MNNLSLENLSKSLQIGDSQGLIESSNLKQAIGDQKPGGTTFAEVLKNSFEQVNEHQVQADQAIRELVSGRSKNLHETMLAVERADSSLKLMMQVRNKVLDAYREIMRMQV
ncbi:MAG: flagellar hook-basal body complex protein FliE [Oligoflexia bacterium]